MGWLLLFGSVPQHANAQYLIKDINQASNSDSPFNLTVANNVFYFAATSPGYGTELWKSDGTANNTVMVKDIYTGSTNENNLLILS